MPIRMPRRMTRVIGVPYPSRRKEKAENHLKEQKGQGSAFKFEPGSILENFI